jgi:protein-tyrosine kinase
LSLVERALKKMQATRQTGRPDAASNGRDGAVPMPEPVRPVGRLEPRTPTPEPKGGTDFVPTASQIIRIDRGMLRDSGMMPVEAQQSEIANQYRTIKRSLVRYAFDPQARDDTRRLVMMGSALPGDGKTFTCVNLALSLALERDHSVLLVDCDLAKPHVSRLFGIENQPGLVDVLADESLAIESTILPTDVPRLSILPAGRRSSVASELVASDRMRTIMNRLGSLYPRGIVLFDSSPVLLTNEARALSSLVGQAVLVVKAGVTPQQAVRDAVEILSPHPRIATILNQAELSGIMGYYYGYEYGYNTREQPEAAASGTDPKER